MPLVDVATLLRVADRAAYQYGQILDVMAAISLQGTAYFWETISATDDVDVEIPCEKPYWEVDDDFDESTAIWGTRLGLIVSGMIAHFNRVVSGAVLQVGGWDGYLTDNDERVSYYFAQLYAATGRGYMLATNVFSEGDDEFGNVVVAAGPSITFTDGMNYGNGSALNPADGDYYAATQLRVVVTTMGATDLDLRLTVKDINDNLTTIDVTVPSGSAPGAVVNIGTAADRFLDVTGVDFVPAGDQGTLGDDVDIKNLKERQVVL
jgi:hypothetical protein